VLDEKTMLGAQFPEILAAARTGAEWAWTGIYRDLSPVVLGYLRARRASEPEDLLGEVFLQVVRDLPRFDGDEREFRAWVFVIAHHRLVDEGRRGARRPVDLEPDGPAIASVTEDVETQVIESTAADGVRRMIDRLPPDQRDVLLLRVLGDLTVKEVARAVGKSPGAVKALQRRGLATIKRTLEKEGVTL
jgi:RNA polymerase sigma-70 factor (ECF subfamily)